MTAQLKELKTSRTRSKEGMLEYLADLTKQVEADEIESFICVLNDSNALVKSAMVGDMSFTEAIGMLATAQTAFQFSHFIEDDVDD